MTRMERLALFPLNTVLFPGMVLPLHIFEDRYRRMIRDCLEARQDFGVVLIKEGIEVGGRAFPYPIGTTARVMRVERLNDGRMNITTVGRRRFRILELYGDRPYLTADIEFMPLRGRDASVAAHLANRVRPRLSRYLDLVAEALGVDIGARAIPHDAIWLAYMTAIVLQIPNADKQRLLEAADVGELLRLENDILRKEEALLRFILRTQKDQDDLVAGVMHHLYRN